MKRIYIWALWIIISVILLYVFIPLYKWSGIRPHNNMPCSIVCHRNSLRIPNAKFLKCDKGNFDCWYTKVGNDTIKIKPYIAELDIMPEDSAYINGNMTIDFASDFYQERLSYCFHNAYPEVLSSEPNNLDDWYICSGMYVLEELQADYLLDNLNIVYGTFKYNAFKNPCFDNKLESFYVASQIAVYELLWELWAKTTKIFSKPTEELLDEYTTSQRVRFVNPMLYIPFPISNVGYMFPAETIVNFNYIADFVESQNFYATLAYIPSDIQKLGEIVKCDENGVLLNLRLKKTPPMKIKLKRYQDYKHDGRIYYMACLKYTRKHSRSLISDEDFRTIMNHNNDKKYDMKPYDSRIFVHLKRMISELNHES